MENTYNLKRKDIVYYAKIVPNCGIYDVYELIVRTIADDYFVGMEKRDKHAFLLYYSDVGKTVFVNRKDALDKVKESEKNKKVVSDETYYEEY